jgi:hypothetical protein
MRLDRASNVHCLILYEPANLSVTIVLSQEAILLAQNPVSRLYVCDADARDYKHSEQVRALNTHELRDMPRCGL